MLSLISGFWEYFFTKPNIKVLIIGLDHAGKTTLLEKIKSKFGKQHSVPLDKIPPTLGMNLAKILFMGSQVILWDLGGQMKMRGIWEKYYDETDCIVFVVDSSDVGRLMEAKLAFATTCDNESVKQVPIIVWATKQDLPGALSAEDISDSFNISSKRDKVLVFPLSSITGIGMDEAFTSMIDLARKHSRKLSS